MLSQKELFIILFPHFLLSKYLYHIYNNNTKTKSLAAPPLYSMLNVNKYSAAKWLLLQKRLCENNNYICKILAVEPFKMYVRSKL